MGSSHKVFEQERHLTDAIKEYIQAVESKKQRADSDSNVGECSCHSLFASNSDNQMGFKTAAAKHLLAVVEEGEQLNAVPYANAFDQDKGLNNLLQKTESCIRMRQTTNTSGLKKS